MFFPDQERLLSTIDQQNRTYQKRWEQFSEQCRSAVQKQNNRQIFAIIKHQLQKRGMKIHVSESDQSLLYGELQRGAKQTLLLYTIFTQPAPTAKELHAIAAQLFALDTYQEISGEMPINLKWLMHSIGEMGNPDLQKIVEGQQLQADGCLWENNETIEAMGLMGLWQDETPLLALGAKGQICVELAIQTAAQAIPSTHGSILPNAAWRLVWALSTIKDSREEILIEGFYDTLQYVEDELVDLLNTLPDYAHALAHQWGVKSTLSDLQSFQLYYTHLLTPTCTVNYIGTEREAQASDTTTIPAEARAQIDFHLVPGQDPQDILSKLQQHLKKQGFDDVQMQLLASGPPLYTPMNNPFVQMVRRATQVGYGREPHLLPILPTSTTHTLLRQIPAMPTVITVEAPEKAGMQENLLARIKQTVMIVAEAGKK